MRNKIHILLIFTIVALLFFVNVNKALAVGTPCAWSGTDPVLCGNISFNDTVDLKVTPIDTYGHVIDSADVTYVWRVMDSSIGTISPTSETNSNGFSVATLTVGSSPAVIPGGVEVDVIYGQDTKTRRFTISASCQGLPSLLYGIAGVSESGSSAFQYSTAEILETCEAGYTLYEGTGSGE